MKHAFTLLERSKTVRNLRRRSGRAGFTLIELLVVISIIVVLLALLTPALDTALYQADLTVCATGRKALVQACQVYAADNQRWYPNERGINRGFGIAETIRQGYDMRDEIDPYADLDGVLNDPLIVDLRFENPPYEQAWLRSPNHWYTTFAPSGGGTGLNRMGDRMTWIDDLSQPMAVERQTELMAADKLVRRVDGRGYTSHPESNGVFREFWYDGDHGEAGDTEVNDTGKNTIWTTESGASLAPTLAYWQGLDANRGSVDLNFGYIDGAVIRIDDIQYNDPRMAIMRMGQDQNYLPPR